MGHSVSCFRGVAYLYIFRLFGAANCYNSLTKDMGEKNIWREHKIYKMHFKKRSRNRKLAANLLTTKKRTILLLAAKQEQFKKRICYLIKAGGRRICLVYGVRKMVTYGSIYLKNLKLRVSLNIFSLSNSGMSKKKRKKYIYLCTTDINYCPLQRKMSLRLINIYDLNAKKLQ